MNRRGFIRAEDLQAHQLEAFPYFPLEAMAEPGGDGDGGASVAADLAEDVSPAAMEARIVDRLQEAERQAQEIARQAYEEGFAAGETEGRAFGESQYRAYIQRLDATLGDLAQTTLTLQEALDEERLALVLAVGEHLALQQIQQSPDGVRATVGRILESLPFPLPRGRREGEMPVQVFLNPSDLAQLGQGLEGQPGMALVADASLSRGSVRVEAPQGILNSTLERRRDHLLALIQRMTEGDLP